MTFKELLTQDQWRSVINTTAGLGAGAISTLLLYPLDLVKVRYQVHEKSAHAYRSLGHAFRSIVAEEGIFALFRGMSPAMYGATLSWGIYMLFYQNAKERYARMAEDGWIQGSWQHFFSGIEAGMIVVPLTNPIWLIKIRMQVQSNKRLQACTAGKDVSKKLAENVPYRSVSDAFRRIVATEGVSALYNGMIPALFLTTNGAIKFVAYERLKYAYQTHWSPEMDVIPTLVMGAVAQSIASTTTYPYQVIKARLQQGGPSANKYTGTWDCTVKIVRHEGYLGLFKGLSANILKVMPTGAIIFAAYEQIQLVMKTMLL
ncbi:mitochondrial folate transporter [Plasmopara halstedii]|uniref:Mitochondrial folate transporter n=1 Tax=Plasmopara halstedii TaxID=4781 RepID=A0A0P1B4Y7_PLAHL|nr:mitochondrial folate transporter [Plasmopara halstedii]CEG49840.1 mitochondrial folate transporter [Plasmopara halstedii]|eukprot:XP_024586209.1 mitochondrial folate transporter [Plasmopara halstedii]